MTVDHEYEPLAGDPGRLSAIAAEYRRVGEIIQSVSLSLAGIASDETQRSEALDAVRDQAREVAQDVSRVRDRYLRTGEALGGYAVALDAAQHAADAAIRDIEAAQSAVEHAENGSRRERRTLEDAQADPDTTPAELAAYRRAADRAEQGASATRDDLARAQQRWRDAAEEKRAAARVAAASIDDITRGKHADGLNDSGWDRFWHGAGEVWEAVAPVLKVICDVAAVASLFLAWVPGVGQLLVAIAAVGALISLVESLVDVATGEGTWLDVLGAAGMVVLTVFGGKLLGMAAKSLSSRAVLQVAAKGGKAATKARGLDLRGAKKFFHDPFPQRLGTALRSPFVRSTKQVESMHKYLNGRATVPELLKGAAKESFGKDLFSRRALLGLDKEVWKNHEIVAKNLDMVSDRVRYQMAAVTTADGLRATTILSVNGHKMSEKAQDGDVLGAAGEGAKIVTGRLDGDWDKVGKLGASTLGLVPR